MRRKRIRKDAVRMDFNSISLSNAKLHIKQFLKLVLPQLGLRSGIDFLVTSDFLRIRHIKTVIGKITTMLKEAFPLFVFYWETPKMLVWF